MQTRFDWAIALLHASASLIQNRQPKNLAPAVAIAKSNNYRSLSEIVENIQKLFTKGEFYDCRAPVSLPIQHHQFSKCFSSGSKLGQNWHIEFRKGEEALLLCAGVMGILEQRGVDLNSLWNHID